MHLSAIRNTSKALASCNTKRYYYNIPKSLLQYYKIFIANTITRCSPATALTLLQPPGATHHGRRPELLRRLARLTHGGGSSYRGGGRRREQRPGPQHVHPACCPPPGAALHCHCPELLWRPMRGSRKGVAAGAACPWHSSAHVRGREREIGVDKNELEPVETHDGE